MSVGCWRVVGVAALLFGCGGSSGGDADSRADVSTSDTQTPSETHGADAGQDVEGPADTSLGDASDASDTSSPADTSGPSDTGSPTDTSSPPPFTWPVEPSPVDVTAHESWKPTIRFGCDQDGCDPFLSQRVFWERPEARWIKFTVPMAAPAQIYFQDSAAYAFHAPFISERLDPWKGLDTDGVNAITLYERGQELILGAVLFAPDMAPHEIGVQLVRQDPYHPEMVRRVLDVVKAALTTTTAVGGADNVDIFYFPTFAQRDSALRWADYFADAGYPVSDAGRWTAQDDCYTSGSSHGMLREVPADALDAVYGTAALGPDDILLTDGIPAEIPHVRGIITLTPASLNSHVALLAEAYGVPFMYAAEATTRARVQRLVGSHVAMRTEPAGFGRCAYIDLLGATFDAEAAASIDALLPEPTVAYPPRRSPGAVSADVDTLSLDSIAGYGGKAANYGFLRDHIGDNVRPGVALSFDVWDGFMAQRAPAGAAEDDLGAWIAARLSGLRWPEDLATLKIRLLEVRGAIEDASFPPELAGQVLDALSGFQPTTRKLRFRSSTNVEDAEGFTGAGLYASYSGCLADDQDGDDAGPSLCNTEKSNERGVFRAIKRVYASFYNDHAYFERLRRGVTESEVAMGVLVHHSFPDALELANGVATFRYRGANSQDATMVTQLGAVSVANPETDAVAEVMAVSILGFGTYPDLVTPSSLVPLGGRVMSDPDDYVGFAELFSTVATAWSALPDVNGALLLDFEYKKIDPDGSGEKPLVIKQVRPLPVPSTGQPETRFAVGGELELCTYQGESGDDAFAVHRLRGIWKVTQAGQLIRTGTAPRGSLHSYFDLTIRSGGDIVQMQGAPSELAGYRLETATDETVEHLSVTGGTIGLKTQLSSGYFGSQPLVFAPEMDRFVVGTWTTPQPGFDFQGGLERSTDGVRLVPCSENAESPGDLRVTRRWTWAPFEGATEGLVTFELDFWWPPPPTGITAGYTAPLLRWESVTITGLTDRPITLTDPWAMSYRPGHHNFSEEVVLEPAMDPSVPEGQRTALSALNIAQIHVRGDGGYAQTQQESAATVHVVGSDGKMRVFKGIPRE